MWQSFSAHQKCGGKSEGKYSGPRVLLEMLSNPCPAFGGLIGGVASPLKLFFSVCLCVSVSLSRVPCKSHSSPKLRDSNHHLLFKR